MQALAEEDRLGERLRASIQAEVGRIEPESQYVVDIELWHRGSRSLIEASRDEVARILDGDHGGAITDHFFGRSIALLRVKCSGAALRELLQLDVVAEVDLPPVLRYSMSELRSKGVADFPEPPVPLEDGPRVCIVDSGIATNHPLLANNVGHAESVLSANASPADPYGHGTGVGSASPYLAT